VKTRAVAHGVKRTAGKICKIHKSRDSPNAQIRKKKSSALIFGGKPLASYGAELKKYKGAVYMGRYFSPPSLSSAAELIGHLTARVEKAYFKTT
jgi:hypothetical protein